jgi:hypothetical protein
MSSSRGLYREKNIGFGVINQITLSNVCPETKSKYELGGDSIRSSLYPFSTSYPLRLPDIYVVRPAHPLEPVHFLTKVK